MTEAETELNSGQLIPFGAIGGIGALAIVVNLASIVWFARTKRKTTHSDTIICSLCVADGIFGTGAVLLFIWKFFVHADPHNIFTYYWNMTQGVSFTSSLLHVMFINVDRLIAVARPRMHKSYMTRSRVTSSLGTIWMISCFNASTQFWMSLEVIDYIVTVLIIVNLLASCAIYIAIVKKLRAAISRGLLNTRKAVEVKKSIALCLGICIMFFVCNTPFAIVTLYHAVVKIPWSYQVSQIMYIILSINCLGDPLLYVFLGRKIGRTRSSSSVRNKNKRNILQGCAYHPKQTCADCKKTAFYCDGCNKMHCYCSEDCTDMKPQKDDELNELVSTSGIQTGVVP